MIVKSLHPQTLSIFYCIIITKKKLSEKNTINIFDNIYNYLTKTCILELLIFVLKILNKEKQFFFSTNVYVGYHKIKKTS